MVTPLPRPAGLAAACEGSGRYRAARGPYAGVSDELLRSRLAEIDADYLDEDPISTRQRRRESISVELLVPAAHGQPRGARRFATVGADGAGSWSGKHNGDTAA